MLWGLNSQLGDRIHPPHFFTDCRLPLSTSAVGRIKELHLWRGNQGFRVGPAAVKVHRRLDIVTVAGRPVCKHMWHAPRVYHTGTEGPLPYSGSSGWAGGGKGQLDITVKVTPGVFPGGAVVKNPPVNAGDTGSSPGPGRSHMLRSS